MKFFIIFGIIKWIDMFVPRFVASNPLSALKLKKKKNKIKRRYMYFKTSLYHCLAFDLIARNVLQMSWRRLQDYRWHRSARPIFCHVC
jgi:hypothetical protein